MSTTPPLQVSITPCCGYDTSRPSKLPRSWLARLVLRLFGPLPPNDVPRAQAVIRWNGDNAAVLCHNCGTIYERASIKHSDEWIEDCRRHHGRTLTGKHAHWCDEWDYLPIDEHQREYWLGEVPPIDQRDAPCRGCGFQATDDDP